MTMRCFNIFERDVHLHASRDASFGRILGLHRLPHLLNPIWRQIDISLAGNCNLHEAAIIHRELDIILRLNISSTVVSLSSDLFTVLYVYDTGIWLIWHFAFCIKYWYFCVIYNVPEQCDEMHSQLPKDSHIINPEEYWTDLESQD